MSTRCQIIVEDATVALYRHSDGYPDGPHGVIKILKKIVVGFIKRRGFDECYMPAHIISDMIVAHKKWADGRIREIKKTNGPASSIESYEGTKLLGYGIEGYDPEHGAEENAFHGDIEFLYVVKKNGTIEVRVPTHAFNEASSIHNTEVQKVVNIQPKKKKVAA
jgi:hypothetical protein